MRLDVTSLYVILAFGMSYLILKRYLFRPLLAILATREREEREASETYAASLRALEKSTAEAEEKLSLARREALRIREGLRGEGLAALERLLAEAHAVSSASIERASLEIEREAASSAAELPRRAGSLARELAEKILGRRLAA